MQRSREVLFLLAVAATLLIARPALGQSANARGFLLDVPQVPGGTPSGAPTRELFAVGGGVWAASVLTEDGTEPIVPGVSGGFEFRPTERLALIVEGTWTGGYEVFQGLTHESFTHLEGKMRIVLSKRWRHQPYLNLGVARVWDRDFVVNAGNPAGIERVDAATYFLWGGGVSLRVRELEIRPELQLYHRGISSALMRPGVSIWYTF